MMIKRLPALLAALCLLAVLPLSGCGASDASPGGSMSEPDADGRADVSDTPDASDPALTVGEARALLAERIDTELYMILEGDARLEVEDERYFVFIVADKATNKVVGQVAVSKSSGARYNYEGEGILGDYSDFPLYDASADADLDWNGEFSDGDRRLTLAQADAGSFEYELDDEAGVARITGATATDGELTFTYDDDGTITLSGSAQGVFTLVS